MIGKKAWPGHSNDSRKPKPPHGSFPNYRPVTSGIRAKMAKGAAKPRSDLTSQTEKGVGEDRDKTTRTQSVEAREDRDSSNSKDMAGDLETRLAKMEIVVGDVQGIVEDLAVRIEGGESGTGELEAEVQELSSGM